MKIKTLVKAVYFSCPEKFGYDIRYPYSVTDIWEKVLKYVEYDNCKKIHLNESTPLYLNLYIKQGRNAVQEWNACTKKEFVR